VRNSPFFLFFFAPCPFADCSSGKYHAIGPSARAYASYLLRDDERVYEASVVQHEKQASGFPRFKEAVRDFKTRQQARKDKHAAAAHGGKGTTSEANADECSPQ
jgi:hypothetical protein